MPDPQTLKNQADAGITTAQDEVVAALAEGAAAGEQVAALQSAIAQLQRIKKRIGVRIAQLDKRDQRMQGLAQQYGERVARATEDFEAGGRLASNNIETQAKDAVKALLPGGTDVDDLVTVVKNFDTATHNLVTTADNALTSQREAAGDKEEELDEAADELDEVERHMKVISDLALATHEKALRDLSIVTNATDETKYVSVVHLRDFLDAYDRLKKTINLDDDDYQFDVDSITTQQGAINKLKEKWENKSDAYRTALLETFEAEIKLAEERIKVAAARVEAAVRAVNRRTLAAEAVREEVEGP
jgi:hypothetical protein